VRARGLLLAALVVGCRLPRAGGPVSGERAEILWDTWGIPHIYAPNEQSLGWAFGWAQAQAHGDLLLWLYGQARGRGAEYWGEAYLEEDRWVRTLGAPERSRAWLESQAPAFRAYLEAFAEGINTYARARGDRIADSVKVVLPVGAADVLAHGHRVLYSTFVVSREGTEGRARAWRGRGSNAWAVAPSRSASGHALLLANPHLDWSDRFTWFEAQLVLPDRWTYGATLVGLPVLAIAFNDRLGWTHTTNTQDGNDLYELTLRDGDYAWDGAARRFEVETQVLRVRRPDGSLMPDTLRIRRSVHGPVVGEKPGKALALRLVGLDRPGTFEQWWAMAAARNLAEFERAQEGMQLSSQNVMYADRDGHILYHYGGNTPVRPRGDRSFWAGVVPGDSSSTLWSRLHAYHDMPRVLDPPSGWLQNANDPPWSSTAPPAVLPSQFPPYLAPLSLAMRPQRSIKLMMADSSVSFEELAAYKHSTRVEVADRLLDDLLSAVQARGNESARRAAAVLGRWDRTADAGSRGGVLFREWWAELVRRMRGRSPYARAWSPAAPLATPDGLALPDTAVAALAAAGERVERTYGALDVPWGEVFRLRRDGVDLPGNGGASALGIFRVTDYDTAGGGRFEATGGDSYVAVIEFGDPVRAAALVSYGNWSQPPSPHRSDQLPLYSRKELRPVWLTRADVEAHLERREQP
jgi:acyl-homoserine-lactone acylase